MKTIVINGKEYQIKQFDMNAICEIEDLGFDAVNATNKTFKCARALVAYTIGADAKTAGEEMQKHIYNGGTLDDFTPLFEAFAESDFFKRAAQGNKEEVEA